ncbi:pyridoxal phosphate-dependent aminotransferase [Acidobacterium capsulatum]|uniref:Aminotransferase n=1 Tax=Acidobacterium capsulatum (strain ATCC 51196 / DSM 11244 / BCRC 80197 / JCM 7670 / NBRC 15755 / NCIMB 13165 / 161) TaxID=240015 RepID=C1F6F7_ACIC5|nr:MULTISPECIES: aminotransferase class I/II-fold pyridoxal phosphate-dependent enzyme [Acidobacterium]ACO34124.1 aminotransferase, classes I and II family protein [Acidobacterium capsulatum ATCC 51196]HCT60748.1 aminotransferase class V-fold PLP-dependent enzyme [Acidobacterium sp.]
MASASALRLSEISPLIVQSEIRSMSVECDRMGGVNLAQGVCDTGVPAPVAERALAAIEQGHNIYTRLDGIAVLRDAIAQKALRYNGIHADPESEVLVTSGATGAFYAACLALLNPGDEVLLFEPFYGYHANTLRAQRAVPVAVPLENGNWAIDFDRLRRAITPRTRALLINTPSNPCGKVFTREELAQIAAIVEEHDLIVFTDEIYEYFVFEGAQHVSFATLPGMASRTITISGLSKTFSITGWRVGYLIADRSVLGTIGYFHDLTYVCAPAPLQHGAAAGLVALPDEYYQAMARDYQSKRDLLCGALTRMGLTPSIPAGAYYVLADASRIAGANAREKARTLLAATGVAAVAGTAFFAEGRGENLLRFCFAKREEDLQRACDLLGKL